MTLQRFRRRWPLHMIAGVCAFGTVACRAPAPPPAPPAPSTASSSAAPLSEENVPAPQRVKVQITDFRQTPSPDNKLVTVTGTLVNRGNRPTESITVRVNGLDGDGKPVNSMYARVDTPHLAADGGTTTFSGVLKNDPKVVRYHVELMAR